MKPLSLLSKTSLLLCATAALISMSAHAQTIEEKFGDVSEVFKKAKTEQEVSQREGAVLDTIASQINSNRKAVFDFFKERADKMNESSSTAWSDLLTHSTNHGAKTAEDFLKVQLTAETVGAFIKIKSAKAVDNFPVTEVDLAQASHAWTTKQRENFARVLSRTNQILETSNAPTLNDAYEQALKDLGYYDEYIKGCKN